MPLLDDFPELQSARKILAAGNLVGAREAFRHATRTQPKNVRALIEFARFLGGQHEIHQAEALLDRALPLAIHDPRATVAVAQGYRSIFRQVRCLHIFQDLRQQGQLPLPILGELAVLLQQLGRFDEALAAIEECVTSAPQQPQPKLIQARVLRHLLRFDESRQILESLVRSPHASPALLVAGWSELAQIHDRIGNYRNAMDYAQQAKDLLRQGAHTPALRAQGQKLNAAFARLYESLDKETVRRWLARSQTTEVQGVAHLLSFPRTGTTLLEQSLDAHPEILAAPERVIFSKLIFPTISRSGEQFSISAAALDAMEVSKLNSQSQRYLRLHSEVADAPLADKYLIDKNPNHTSLWAGLVRLLPESKFIVTRRDPRDVVISCYLQHLPLSEYSQAFLDLETTCQLYQSEHRILERLLNLLPDRCLEVHYENMVEDLPGAAHRVIEFLGLPRHSAVGDYRETTESKIINSPTQADARRPVYTHRMGRWENYADFLKPYLSWLE